MFLKSYSKVNLSLSVIKKIKKIGKHEIQSFFCLLNLFDNIKIKKINAKKDLIKFKGQFANLVKNKNNSISHVLRILREKKIIKNYYSILINKKIPVFAGMGGGTSNAFFIANYLTKNAIDKDLLKIFKKRIGSDFELFFYKQGFLFNLNKILKYKKKYKIHFLLVYPNIKCSTKLIYSKFKNYSLPSKQSFININNSKKFFNFLKNKNNDLQSVVEKKHPIIKKIIQEIGKKRGCYFSRMTGSGSVCYGVFKCQKTAKGALNRIRIKYPKYWSVIAKTI